MDEKLGRHLVLVIRWRASAETSAKGSGPESGLAWAAVKVAPSELGTAEAMELAMAQGTGGATAAVSAAELGAVLAEMTVLALAPEK